MYMKSTPLHVLFFVFLLHVTNTAFSQNFWSAATSDPTGNLARRNFLPVDYQFMTLNLSAFKQAVSAAPKRFGDLQSNVVVSMPDALGVLREFEIYEAPMMEQGLYSKYPSIRTYVGTAVQAPKHIVRFSVTYQGLHSITFIPGAAAVYTDPFTVDGSEYIIYDRAAIPEMTTSFICETLEPEVKAAFAEPVSDFSKAANDGILRRYRVAISCTAEYGNFFAGTTGADAEKRMRVQAQQIITMNRVNGVYERDLAITMEFAAQNDILLYFGDTSVDPYTTDFNGRTQQLIDGNLNSLGFPGIGNAAYDIGHNFNTIDGGNAGCIGCVCVAGQKGSGMTGRVNPTGDPFDIDYVAHEMGHQFGGFHTMASSNCRSGNGQTEAEPGSGSTIMAYAGICAPNVQQNSNDYFHYVSVRDITANMKTGVSSSCPTVINIGTTAPQANAGLDYVIPFSTPFVLNGTATNVNSGSTFIWEQFDTDNPRSAAGPVPTREFGPMYRSRPPVTSTLRYFPQLSSVLAGNLAPAFEVTPAVGRTMKFAFTARNFTIAGGQNNDDDMRITIDGSKGPFAVTSINTPVTFNTGESVNLTWNIADTNLAPVNTQFVDILLSIDGGLTFTIPVATAITNDGAHVITIPVITPTNNARLMIKAAGNVYYAVNAAPVVITRQNFSLSTAALNAVACQPSSPVFNFTYNVFAGFTETTTLGVTGLPVGVSAVITPQTVSATGTAVQVSFTGINNASPGNYPVTLVATAPSVTRTVPLNIAVLSPALSATSLESPVNNAINQDLTPVLSWLVGVNASSYNVEVALDMNFTNITAQSIVSDSEFIPSLQEDTVYYWRVRSINDCATGSPSAVRTFRTGRVTCETSNAINLPIVISTGAPSTITSTINVMANLNITSVTVGVALDHSYMDDLVITLISPAGTRVVLLEASCGTRNDLDAVFSDEGFTLSCNQRAPTVSGVVVPKDALAGLIAENSTGLWTLEVADTASQDGGALNTWNLTICGMDKTLSVNNPLNQQFRLYPNPAQDLLTIDFGNYAFAKAHYQLYDLTGKIIASGSVTAPREQLQMTGISQGIYLLRLNVDGAAVTRKIIME
jgi:subtilisin-like proprotein convertase family protein